MSQTYTVPLIDPDTGDGFDVEVEAESPREAMQKADGPGDKEYHVASTFIRKHLEVELPDE